MTSSDPFLPTLHKWFELLMRRTMHNALRFSKDRGLSMSQIGAMFQIHHGTGGVSEIGDELGVTSAAASQMLERLVQQGFIVRSEDPQDRRFKKIVLTGEGHKLLDEVIQTRQSWLNDLADLMTPEEKEQVTGALNILIEKLNQLEINPESPS
jgi:DNA-binding MarR family transcriptional regulator